MASRGEISEEQVSEVVEGIHARIESRLAEKGRGSMASSHEILGILEEEMYEYKMAVHKGDALNRVNELEDIAVGALFGIACILNGEVDW